MALSLIGSSFFAGTFLGSFILPRLADVYGRKPIFMVGLIMYILTVQGLLFSTNKNVMYALLFLGGVSETGRYYVAYVYAVEIAPKRL
jgi:MFS family permease